MSNDTRHEYTGTQPDPLPNEPPEPQAVGNGVALSTDGTAAGAPQATPQNIVQGHNVPVPVTPVFLTGSQIQLEKKKLPVGVYVLTGFTLLSFLASFFDSSQTSVIYSVAMLVSLLVAIGLVLRMEAARKFMTGYSVVLLVLTIVSIVLLVGLQQRIRQNKANYEAAVNRIDQSRLTSNQKQLLEAMSMTLAAQEKQAGKAISFTYFKLGSTALVSLATIVYLTRPKVREAFEPSRL
ncbi:MAG TPA: hypothetical protein VK674_04315 [Candidatus Limnocylindria bacterium]|nr:hypothetical protein [Candidatus Limnocylindria bacterium]